MYNEKVRELKGMGKYQFSYEEKITLSSFQTSYLHLPNRPCFSEKASRSSMMKRSLRQCPDHTARILLTPACAFM